MKKTLFIALAAMMALLAAGCDNGSSEPEPVAVESVTLNVTTLSLAPGAKGKLTATVTPDNADDKTVKWSSDNTSVASVDYYGTVKAVKVGTANITAQAGGKTATCVIKVHVHSYSGGKCTVCGFAKPSMPDGEIDDDGVLTKYTGNGATVVIPDGVTYIGASAFSDCMSLASVTIPASVTSIGHEAFKGCESLTDVTYKGTLAQWCALSNGGYLMYYAKRVIVEGTDLKQAKTLVIPDGVTSIGEYAFYGCTSLASVKIPASVTSIKDCAFNRCESLTSVTIPDGVTSIGEYAFYGCTSLASVEIPASVTSIGDAAFWGCTSLASVEIPGSVTSIGGWAFQKCTSLASVTYGGTKDGWSKIEKGIGIFYCTKVTQITDKDGVKFTVDGDGDITE